MENKSKPTSKQKKRYHDITNKIVRGKLKLLKLHREVSEIKNQIKKIENRQKSK